MSVVSSRTGASAVSKSSEVNPRQIVVNLIEENPGASKEALFSSFRDEVERDERARRAVEWYFFINMYEYAASSRNKKEGPVERAERKFQDLEKQQVIVETIKAQLIMLNLIMPNGKLMRDCTGIEMAKFGSRYKAIADKVGKSKIVGEVLSEEQVREIIQ